MRMITTFFSSSSRIQREDKEEKIAGSRVGRGSLVKTRVGWRNSTPRFDSTPERRNENIIYSISSNGNRTHNLSRLQSTLVSLRVALKWKYVNYLNKTIKPIILSYFKLK